LPNTEDSQLNDHYQSHLQEQRVSKVRTEVTNPQPKKEESSVSHPQLILLYQSQVRAQGQAQVQAPKGNIVGILK
jgi:hypothetical protein